MKANYVHKRDTGIDILRGIAILIMLGANVLGYVTSCDLHPLWFNILSSIAAPLFIMLSGYMAAHNAAGKNRGLNYYLIRGGMLLLTGILVDAFIWRIIPGASFDVLYLIGLSLPLIYIIRKESLKTRAVYMGLVLLIAFALQRLCPYAEYPVEIEYGTGRVDLSEYTAVNALRGIFLDGWFPVFPWIAMAVAGSIFASIRPRMAKGFADRRIVLSGAVAMIAGFAGVYIFYSAEAPFDLLMHRDPYGEIFYPATPLFIMGGMGACILLTALVDATRNSRLWTPLTIMGQASLFNYILHLAIISYLIYPAFDGNKQPLSTGWLVYAALTAVCLAASLGVSAMKKKVKSKNFYYKFYFGG
ncbi:MAG: DUF1624 domain-containing protein [Tannerellaceae bacterium]|jgi:uncharacterized membrane protein|nr:DUF1624 domain-containing protein [Tannerellaceae bacterium]